MSIKLLQNIFEINITDLKNKKFMYVDLPDACNRKYSYIDPIDVVGTANSSFCFDNYYDFYDSFHKEILLDENKFNKAIIKPLDNVYPTVYMFNNEYYIVDGRHRLILSQLHKLNSIKVVLLTKK